MADEKSTDIAKNEDTLHNEGVFDEKKTYDEKPSYVEDAPRRASVALNIVENPLQVSVSIEFLLLFNWQVD